MPDKEIPSFSHLAEGLIGSFRRIPSTQPARMRNRPTRTLAELVDELIIKHSIGLASPENTIREHWAEIVGHSNAAYSHPSQIDPRGKLIVLAAHAVVRNELFLHRASIVPKLQKLPGCSHIKAIHLRSG